MITTSRTTRYIKPVRRQMICGSLVASGREALAHLWLRLCGTQLMLQTTIGDGLAFDPFAFDEDGLGPSEVDVSRSEIAEALVIASMVVVLDEGRDLTFEISGQVVVLKQDAVLERLMPALDLTLGLWVIGGAADVLHFLVIQPLREIRRDVR